MEEIKKDDVVLLGADFLMDGGTTASYWYGDLSYRRNTMGK